MESKSGVLELEKQDESNIRVSPTDGIRDEKEVSSQESQSYSTVKRDKHGLPFVPPPSPYIDDPLVSSDYKNPIFIASLISHRTGHHSSNSPSRYK